MNIFQLTDFVEGSPGRNSSRNLKQKVWRKELPVSSLIDPYLAGFLIQPRTMCSWNGAINSVLDPPISVNSQDNI